jgi:hypothetical protein
MTAALNYRVDEDTLKTYTRIQLVKRAKKMGLKTEGVEKDKQQLVRLILDNQLDSWPTAAEEIDKLAETMKKNKEFEALTAAAIAEDLPADGEDKKRGGWRPGAGRPKGSTAEICAVRALPEQANEAVKASLEALFTLWSIKAGIDEVKLSQEEALRIALPVTQIMELNGFGIPQSAHVYIMGVWSIWEVTAAKIAIIQAAKKQQLKPVESEIVK